MRGQGGCQETRGRTSRCPRPPPQPHPVPGLPLPLGFRGSPTTQPHPGVNAEPFETSKAQAGLSEGGGVRGREQEYDFGQEGAPSPPLLVEPPLLARPAAATPCCGACYPSSHLLEILWVAEFLDSDREEVAGDVGDDHVGAG